MKAYPMNWIVCGHCFVIHKEHFTIVLYRVHELLGFRIVKASICRIVFAHGILGCMVLNSVWFIELGVSFIFIMI